MKIYVIGTGYDDVSYYGFYPYRFFSNKDEALRVAEEMAKKADELNPIWEERCDYKDGRFSCERDDNGKIIKDFVPRQVIEADWPNDYGKNIFVLAWTEGEKIGKSYDDDE